ncbi:MAG: response regulator [Lachnospiraceae bacterium]|nr:response regulator [Lachnospiraceae bacterium]
MIRLFLVEDEIVMREGIKRRIDWEKEGISFVGEASDGELAYPMILETRPDIVITDIKMPFMDGLKLSELIRKELPETKIMILSGYDEFSYAKEAIKLGVTEYLLKPITPAALLQSVRGVAKKIVQEREKKGSDYEKKEMEALQMFSELAQHFLEKKDAKTSAPETVQSERFDAVGTGKYKELESFLKTGSVDEAPDAIDSIFASIGEQNARSLMFLNYITMDLYFTMARFLKEIGAEESLPAVNDACGDINTMVRQITDMEKARDYLTAYLKEVLKVRDQGANRKYGRILQDAVRYIDEHFADEDISLNTLAERLNMSPNHFSAVFSQEMGQPFIEYLINKRMEKAKELLMTTDKRSSEIAYAVGYKDPHYFSYTFKKTQGMTAKEYRGRGTEALPL